VVVLAVLSLPKQQFIVLLISYDFYVILNALLILWLSGLLHYSAKVLWVLEIFPKFWLLAWFQIFQAWSRHLRLLFQPQLLKTSSLKACLIFAKQGLGSKINYPVMQIALNLECEWSPSRDLNQIFCMDEAQCS